MRAWRADLASTAFGKIIAVYGHIAGKCLFVRKMRFAYGHIVKNRLFVRKSG